MATRASKFQLKALDVLVPSNIGGPSLLASHITATPVGARQFSTASSTLGSTSQPSSSSSSSDHKEKQQQRQEQQDLVGNQDTKELKPTATRKKTIAELDAEMMKKMSGIAGDGGSAGIEYEDGQPVSMKRGVKNNMFRYI